MEMRKLFCSLLVAAALVVFGTLPGYSATIDVIGSITDVNPDVDGLGISDPDNLGLDFGDPITGFVDYDETSGTVVAVGVESFDITGFSFDFGGFQIDFPAAATSPFEALLYFSNGVFSGWGIDVDVSGLGIDDYQFAMTGSTAGVTSFDLFSYEYSDVVASGNIAPVPEPGTFVLLGAGLGGLVLYRRRQKKA